VNPPLADTSKVNGLGLFTGQIGCAWNAALLYVKGVRP
jgi:outer membrane immunogenic protein